MTQLLEEGRFFLPGPTEVRPDVLAAMTRPMIPHRGEAFERLFAGIQVGLKRVFRTARPVLISSSSATGLMEAGVRCAPAGAILAMVNGAFSERFAQVARACGRTVEVLEVPLGETVPLEQVEAKLRAGSFAALTVVHSETSTGALTDVRAVQDLTRRHGAMCLVDSVTGVAGTPLESDAWEMDYVFTGSQKALALPPGLAFAVASESFLAQARSAGGRGLYFDLVEFDVFARKDQTPNTPAISLLYALEAQLTAVSAEGIEARWSRHSAMAARVRNWVADHPGYGILAPTGERSDTVTAVTVPEGATGREIAAGVEREGYVIGAGYGKLRDRTFRIGHMGDHTVRGLDGCLAAIDRALPHQ
ncbi:MAG: alanine--glyoxylate aminotransferase family protein [Gemmatimonadota bacterium]